MMGNKRQRTTRIQSSDEGDDGQPGPSTKRPRVSLKMPAGDEDDSPLSDIDIVADDSKPSLLKMTFPSSRIAPVPTRSVSGTTARTSFKRIEEPGTLAELASEEDEADFTDDDDQKPKKARKTPASSKAPTSKSTSKQSSKSKPRRATKRKVESEDDNFQVNDIVASDEDFVVDEDGARPKGKGRSAQNSKAAKAKAQDKPILARDERAKHPISSVSSTQSVLAARRHIAETDPEKDKPPLASTSAEPHNKRPKLPSVKKRSQIVPTSASAAGTPNARAVASSASVSVVPRGGTKPKASEVDLSNPDEYAKLFGITPSTASKKPVPTPPSSSLNYKASEQRAIEIQAAREQARIDREKDWDASNTFDMQYASDCIRAYEEKLWKERRYMYMTQVAAAWAMKPVRPGPEVAPHLPDSSLAARHSTTKGTGQYS